MFQSLGTNAAEKGKELLGSDLVRRGALQCILCRQNVRDYVVAAGQQATALDSWIEASFGEQAIKNVPLNVDNIMHAPIVTLREWAVNIGQVSELANR